MNLLVQLEDKGANCMQNDRVLIPRRHRGLTLSRLSISNEFALDALLASLEGTGELSVSGEYISLAAITQQPHILYQANNKCD